MNPRSGKPTNPKQLALATVAAMTLALLGTITAVVGSTAPAVAAPRPDTIDLDALRMVPERTWGVSGMDPGDTQTPEIMNLVWDFAEIGDRIFVGGAFLNVQENRRATPIPQPFVAAFDVASGDWISSWTPQLDRAIYALDVLPNGSLLVGGEFETVNGQARAGLVALDPLTGLVDPSFAGEVERPWSSRRAVVRDLEVDGDRVYAAGSFSHLNGTDGTRTRVYRVGRFDTTGTIDTAWKPEVAGSGIWGLDTDRSRNEVHLTGFFTSVNGEADSGHFHTVDGTTGATAPGKIELPRNFPALQPEMFDVAYGEDLVFVIGEQHVVQVLDADDQNMIGFNSTGSKSADFVQDSFFTGGGYQVGEKIGDVVFAGCHCTYSIRDGQISHFSSFDGERTPHRLVMAYEASTGELIDQFMPDIHSPSEGTWAIGSDSNGCLYVGGDFHVGGVDSGTPRWLGGFAKLCGNGPRVDDLMVDLGSQWRYDDSGTDLGESWRDPAFDDSGWSVGPAEFGFGDGDEETVLSTGNLTYYARKSFSFTGPKPPSLELRLKADDGAVVYLNGVEILRDNLPDGVVTASTAATTWRSGAAEGLTSFIVPAWALAEGANVLAVEVHNVWASNNDLSFDLWMAPSEVIVEPQTPPLVPIGAQWAHTDSAVGQPAGWPTVVDGPAADAEFGFGEGDEATVLPSGQETYYFSHQFEVTDAAAINKLKLCLLADDGAVVYLNGAEINRFNMPAGVIDWNTRPLNWVSNADERFIDYDVDSSALIEGTNTLAVEVHNYWPGNPDLSFDACLEISE